jgi:hypothetical protein
MTTINYKNKIIIPNLIFSMFWLMIGLVSIFLGDEHTAWWEILYLVTSILYLFNYFYMKRKQYLFIKSGWLHKSGLLSEKINMSEITHIKKSSGEYRLISKSKQLLINTKLINNESLDELHSILDELDIQPSL